MQKSIMENDMNKMITEPVTKQQLIDTLKRLGVSGGQIIEVHASLSAFGYVVGGAETVVDALMEIAKNGGTILMPVQCKENSEPSKWKNPAILPSKYKEVRNSIPAYHQGSCDIQSMGAVAENFRHREGVCISSHPSLSYAAWGRYAKLLCNRQSLHFPLAEESPCARLYELKGKVLLLGVDFDKCTCMHLAEYRCDCRPIAVDGVCVEEDGSEIWKKYLDLSTDNSAFMKVKAIMARKNMIRETTLGNCKIQYFSGSQAIDEATKYFEKTVVYDLYR